MNDIFILLYTVRILGKVVLNNYLLCTEWFTKRVPFYTNNDFRYTYIEVDIRLENHNFKYPWNLHFVVSLKKTKILYGYSEFFLLHKIN